MTIADDYVNRVLDLVPRGTPQRSQIAMDLRSHIAERLEHGQPEDEVLRQLGDPVALAESYLSVEPLVSATFGQRTLAKAIDAFLVTASFIVLAAGGMRIGGLPFFLLPIFVILGSSLLFGIYTIVAELHYGQTVGKRLVGIRVVRESGTRIGLGQAIVRSVPMFLQFYYVDVLFPLFTERSQRAFELLSKTRVVRG